MPKTEIRSRKTHNHEHTGRHAAANCPIDRAVENECPASQIGKLAFSSAFFGFSSERSLIERYLSMTRPMCETSTDRNDATAPRRKAGAAVCEITTCS